MRTDHRQPFPILFFEALAVIANNPFGQLLRCFSANFEDSTTPKLTFMVSKSGIVPSFSLALQLSPAECLA